MNETKTEKIIIQDLGHRSYKEAWDLQKQIQQQRIRFEIQDTLILVEHDLDTIRAHDTSRLERATRQRVHLVMGSAKTGMNLDEIRVALRPSG